MSGRRARRCEVAKRAARVRLVVRLHTICPFVNVLVTYSLDYSTPPPEFALRFWQMRISTRYLEPLQDWVLLRNLLSISLRLDGTMRTMRSEAAENNLLVKSGFIKSERSTLSSKLAIDAPGYTIPVMFNPFYRDGNALINDATFDDESTWPLYRTIAESPPDSTAIATRATFAMSHISHGQSRAPRDLQRNRAASAASPLATIMTTHQMAP